MGTNLIRAILLASASAAVVVAVTPAAAYAQEATYQIDIPAQSMGDALRALGKATKQNIVFSGSVVKGKRSAAVRGRMSASDALSQMLAGSGLKTSRGSGGGLVVMSGNADAAPARAEAPETIATGSVSANASTIVDARTGAALKGALVEIVETGEKTSTGNLGEFRFPGRTGSYNLRISYLGYPQYEQFVELKDGRASAGILLSDGGPTAEIIVYGTRSARAQSLNQERTAPNVSTVISSDLLGRFEGTTISEALRSASGVAFQPDTQTGDGTNIMVRGLGSDFNTVTLNGLRLPVGDGRGRSPALNNILTDSISKVTINKTLLPSQDSSGTGGLIEIETKGPIERGRSFNLSAEYGNSAKGFLDEKVLSGSVSRTFGSSENLGLSLSIQYRNRDIKRLSYFSPSDYGQYLPLGPDRQPYNDISEIDPSIQFPFEQNVQDVLPSTSITSYNGAKVRDLSINAAFQWKIGDHTNLRLDYNRNDQKQETFIRESSFGTYTSYEPLPIVELQGEIRPARIWEGAFGLDGAYITNSQTYAYTPNQSSISQVLSLRGQSTFGDWDFDYGGGYTIARNKSPNRFSLTVTSANSDQPIDKALLLAETLANTRDGRMVGLFAARAGNGFPMPLLNEAGYSFFNNPGSYFTSFASSSGSKGRNDRYSANLSIRKTFQAGPLKYIRAGVFLEHSRSSSLLSINGIEYESNGYNLIDLGLSFANDSLQQVGIRNSFRVIPTNQVINLANNISSINVGGNPAFTAFPLNADPRNEQVFTREREIASFIEAKAEFGKIEIVGGVRREDTNVRAVNLQGARFIDENGVPDLEFAQNNTRLYDDKARIVDWLPRGVINYRPDDNSIVRFGYYMTVARPQITQLNSLQTVILALRPIYGPNGNQPILVVTEGNPGLKPAYTHSFDLSIERYAESIGVLKASVFYKSTKNLIQDNTTSGFDILDGVVLPDDERFQAENLPPNLFVQGTRAINSPYNAKLWGFELSAERQFSFLPGALAGLGIYANYTYTDSSKVELVPYSGSPTGVAEIRGAPYLNQAKHSGTVSLNYTKYGIDSSLSYTRQSAYLTSFRANGLSAYTSPIDSLDFRISYNFELSQRKFSAYLIGADLLKNVGDADNRSSIGGYNFSANYVGGRVFRIGVTAQF